MVGYLFAGQGSQYVGMGKDLYVAFPESKAIFDRADKVLGFSLSRLMFDGPKEQLTKTNNCQPAIVVMSLAAFEAFRKNVRAEGQESASFVAGLSLGEYSALVAAGAISFEDAVRLVRKRGEFMEEEALKKPGRMLSIIGLDLAKVQQICLKSNTEISNINCPGQIVVSGGILEIERAKQESKKENAKMTVALETSGAFHSSFMKQAALKLAKELEKININTPHIPIVCNVSARPTESAAEIKQNLIKQVASSVLWEDSMKFMLSKGIRNFVEFGPGKVLKGLMRRIEASAEVINIEKKEDILSFKVEV